MRKRGRVDSTHGEIVETFRKASWQVLSLAPLGGGAPDLLVAPPWVTHGNPRIRPMYLIECKTGKGKLREAQQAFSARWPVFVLRSVEDVLAFMKNPGA